MCAVLRPTSTTTTAAHDYAAGSRFGFFGFRFGCRGSSSRRAFEGDLLAHPSLMPGLGLGLDDCAPWSEGAHARTARAVLVRIDEAVSESTTDVLGVIIYIQFAAEAHCPNSNSTDSCFANPYRPPAYRIKRSSPVTATKSTTWNNYNKFTIPGNKDLEINGLRKCFQKLSRLIVHNLPGIKVSSPGPPAGLKRIPSSERIRPTHLPNSRPGLCVLDREYSYTHS